MTKIMVIDDDENFTNLYKTTLIATGFDTIAVNHSPAAIDMAHRVKPDIFIIDLMMPDIDGFQLCRMIRDDPVIRDIPIIIVTALTDSESREVAMGVGANEYLTKPFTIDKLKLSINAMLNGAK